MNKKICKDKLGQVKNGPNDVDLPPDGGDSNWEDFDGDEGEEPDSRENTVSSSLLTFTQRL